MAPINHAVKNDSPVITEKGMLVTREINTPNSRVCEIALCENRFDFVIFTRGENNTSKSGSIAIRPA